MGFHRHTRKCQFARIENTMRIEVLLQTPEDVDAFPMLTGHEWCQTYPNPVAILHGTLQILAEHEQLAMRLS
jgi:hypothetical protein